MSNTTSKNLASTRIATLLDEGSFVEIGGAVTARTTDFNMQEKETPADGVITGYGVIDGNLVYVYSQDASVLKGAIGEMHAKKIANIYDRLRRIKTSRGNGCIEWIWQPLYETGYGIWGDSTDYSSFWKMRWWTCRCICDD